jgi:hypothetical protein
MDGTLGVDKTKPIGDQIISLLEKRYVAPHTIGGETHYHSKVAKAILKLVKDASVAPSTDPRKEAR